MVGGKTCLDAARHYFNSTRAFFMSMASEKMSNRSKKGLLSASNDSFKVGTFFRFCPEPPNITRPRKTYSDFPPCGNGTPPHTARIYPGNHIRFFCHFEAENSSKIRGNDLVRKGLQGNSVQMVCQTLFD